MVCIAPHRYSNTSPLRDLLWMFTRLFDESKGSSRPRAGNPLPKVLVLLLFFGESSCSNLPLSLIIR
uniref:Uncharacterized protein n=1 Tax=Utricularia reniformis TaxID=192314 RepID=A0A1Y0B2A1_9LAMI|nr:hypothetical protein AEK19_MT1320 [Utricularia reniformis]ART31520.1 hypothetical protein AEK19_MT1320 [Utricularia reniformis]